MADDVRIQNVARRDTPPGTYEDGALGYGRANRYGEEVVVPLDRATLCDEGSYFVATNSSPGSALAGITAANGYDDTEALVYLANDHATKHIYPDYLHLTVKVAGANGTDFAYAIDVATEATYSGSGGTEITPVDTNRETNNTAPVTMYFGAVVTTTGTTEKIMSHGQLLTVIKVIGGHYLFTFGGPGLPPATTIMESGAQHSVQRSCPPIVIPPGHAWCFREFASSQSATAAQYQFEMGFWVR